MINRIKKIFKTNSKSNTKVSDVQPIIFPGGITPINQTLTDDVFIVGFPKSGNTLMQHIITHIVYGINEEGSRTLINLIAPDIYANPYYFRFNERCFFKSHERPQPNYKKVIYLMRDGREALLSYYHMMKNMDRDISLEDLYTGKIDIFGGQWHEHIEAWEKNPYNAEILWVKYEDLINDKLIQLQNIVQFLGLDRTEEELQTVAKLTSLAHMKSLEKRADWQKMNIDVSFNKGSFVRMGAVDSFKVEVPDIYLEVFEKMSKNSKYSFSKSDNKN